MIENHMQYIYVGPGNLASYNILPGEIYEQVFRQFNYCVIREVHNLDWEETNRIFGGNNIEVEP